MATGRDCHAVERVAGAAGRVRHTRLVGAGTGGAVAHALALGRRHATAGVAGPPGVHLRNFPSRAILNGHLAEHVGSVAVESGYTATRNARDRVVWKLLRRAVTLKTSQRARRRRRRPDGYGHTRAAVREQATVAVDPTLGRGHGAARPARAARAVGTARAVRTARARAAGGSPSGALASAVARPATRDGSSGARLTARSHGSTRFHRASRARRAARPHEATRPDRAASLARAARLASATCFAGASGFSHCAPRAIRPHITSG